MVFVGNNQPNERKNKIDALLKRNAIKEQNKELKKQMYEGALWTSDSKSKTFSLADSNKATTATQTDDTTTATSTASSNNSSSGSSNSSNSVFSTGEDFRDRGITTADMTGDFSIDYTDDGNEWLDSMMDDVGRRLRRASTISDSDYKSNTNNQLTAIHYITEHRDIIESNKPHPVDSEGRSLIEYIIRGDGAIIRTSNNKVVTSENELYIQIDWLKTLFEIRDLVESETARASFGDEEEMKEEPEYTVDNGAIDWKDYRKRLTNLWKQNKELFTKQNIEIEPYDSDGNYIKHGKEGNRFVVDLAKNGQLLSVFTMTYNKSKKAHNDTMTNQSTNDDSNFSWIITTNKFLEKIRMIQGVNFEDTGFIRRVGQRRPRNESMTTNAANSRLQKRDGNVNYKKDIIEMLNKMSDEYIDKISVVGWKASESQNGTPRYQHGYKFDKKGNVVSKQDNVQDLNLTVDWERTHTEVFNQFKEYQQSIQQNDSSPKKQLGKGMMIPRHGMLLGGAALRSTHPPKLARGIYDLRDIKDRNCYSALAYREIGSKWINLRNLQKNKLTVCYANRTNCGRVISITPELTEVIKTLVYDKRVDENLYNKLETDDKLIFRDLLKKTHMDFQMKTPIPDAIDSLTAEYNKLIGAIKLGNYSDDVIRELKVLSADLFQYSLIDKKQFQEIQKL